MKSQVSKFIFLLSLTLFSLSVTPQDAFSAPLLVSQATVPANSSNLSLQQKDEISKIIDERLEKSITVSDRIQTVVYSNFGLLFALVGLLVSVLSALPILSGITVFVFKKAILRSIENAIIKELLETGIQDILEAEIKKQMSSRFEEELSKKIKHKLKELEQQASSDLSAFKDQLNQLNVDAEQEKSEFLSKLTSFDSVVLRDAAAKAVADKIAEFKRFRPPFPALPGRRDRLN
ncbi:MAG: hypothetical protein HY785_13770 [Oscillatoriophycideae cyanobacterium NC_groundwater_1537_Pr4_S-0.65um_50_18]|nr:hypothetical protein [Oscillatoriophycideae cyanobacterium NC_groundwater_1537_Pr4_S-0.65um_50_18]